jgi:hypothetical protein
LIGDPANARAQPSAASGMAAVGQRSHPPRPEWPLSGTTAVAAATASGMAGVGTIAAPPPCPE